MLRNTSLVMILSLVALVGLAGSAIAQGGQTVTVQPDSLGWYNVPDELPGTYHGVLEVETTVSGGTCLCTPGTTTTVQFAVQGPDAVTDTVVSPTSYAIDWWSDPTQPVDAHHVKAVEVFVHVTEYDADLLTIQLDTQAATNSPHLITHGLSSEYALPAPGFFEEPDGEEQETTHASANTTSDQASHEADADRQEAAIASHDAADSLVDEAAVPGTGAAVAGLAALGMAVARRRS